MKAVCLIEWHLPLLFLDEPEPPSHQLMNNTSDCPWSRFWNILDDALSSIILLINQHEKSFKIDEVGEI